ncbi:MAG: NAD-dependent malic enzyme [Duodenibacillus sp.]|nr:NAD-dependent malic enzyme [Duodenibacillus sp.]
MTQCEKKLCGTCLLRNPWKGRGLAHTEEERRENGLTGLLPAAVETRAQQVARWKELIAAQSTPLNKYLMLDTVRMIDEALYFQLVVENVEEYMPLIYTPTVGEACQKFSHIYRAPRGLYITAKDAGHVREVVANVPNEEVDIIVVTDGQRILGLGDLGANGMGIPIGKLALYTACAGVNPQRALPVTIDAGTNNEEFLADPLYIGLRQKRMDEDSYYALIAEFVAAVRERWPNVLIQFEDFQNTHAFALLDEYRNKVPCFNDDIQGTASVVVTGFYSAMRVKNEKLSDQRILFLGAGSAATGIAHLLADAMVEEGTSREKALGNIFLYDSKGLVSGRRTDKLAANKLPFAHDVECASTFEDAIRQLKPTAIVGVSAQPKSFNAEVVGMMAEYNEHPIVFALSNPTSKAECTAEEAYKFSNGTALFACGSPFAPVELNGKTFVPRQGNNSYVFPAIGMGCIYTRAKSVPNGVFLAAAKKLADLVSAEDLENGSLYPPLSEIRSLSVEIAAAVAEYCFDHDLAQIERPACLKTAVAQAMWNPADPQF